MKKVLLPRGQGILILIYLLKHGDKWLLCKNKCSYTLKLQPGALEMGETW